MSRRHKKHKNKSNQDCSKALKALEMYDSGASILAIQEALGKNITVRQIRRWSVQVDKRTVEQATKQYDREMARLVNLEAKQQHKPKVSRKQHKAQKKVEGSLCYRSGCGERAYKKCMGEWYCRVHYKEQCRVAGLRGAAKRWGKQKRVKVSEAERRKRIFASWKNPELDKLRMTPEYQIWRIAVLERDGYKCQHCQETGGRLHAHHIKTFKMNPELRYDVENGITLCKKCHEDLHIANVDKMNIINIRRKAV